MDRLTHISITNCIKELDALEKLVLSGEYSRKQLADWIAQISWEMSNIFRRRRYDSDELQFVLRGLIRKRKQQENKNLSDKDKKDD